MTRSQVCPFRPASLSCGLTNVSLQLERFESLSVTPAGPGQPPGLSPAMLPRPLGDDAERGTEAPKLAHPRNCSAKFMRVTVSAIPSQQVANACHTCLNLGPLSCPGAASPWQDCCGDQRAVYMVSFTVLALLYPGLFKKRFLSLVLTDHVA